MGNAESLDHVKNVDKNTARKLHKNDFVQGIEQYKKGTTCRSVDVDAGMESSWGINVCIRKRPLFDHERLQAEFDCMTCHDKECIVVHNARMHSDMRQQIIEHNEFHFNKVFDENSVNFEVYSATVRPLIDFSIAKGGLATCLMYGQTGSGKTYTMSSMCELATADIFAKLEGSEQFQVSASFVEMIGSSIYDLFNDRRSIQILTDCDGKNKMHPLKKVVVEDAAELMQVYDRGQSARKTAATAKNDTSSRSHSIFQIHVEIFKSSEMKEVEAHTGSDGAHSAFTSSDIVDPDEAFESLPSFAAVVEKSCTVSLVDLAGSEMSGDSKYHDADRRKECAHINKSLMALKECLRARALTTSTGMSESPGLSSQMDGEDYHEDGNKLDKTARGAGFVESSVLAPQTAAQAAASSLSHIYRKDKLTMALKSAFTDPLARTVVVCTVSPCGSDTEHSLSTLRHACVMAGQNSSPGTATSSEGQENTPAPADVAPAVETRFLTGGRVTTTVIGTVKPAPRKGGVGGGRGGGLTTGVSGGKASSAATVGEEGEIEGVATVVDEEVHRLEEALADPKVSAATKYGLKKRLAMRKAQLKKEQKALAEAVEASAGSLVPLTGDVHGERLEKIPLSNNADHIN